MAFLSSSSTNWRTIALMIVPLAITGCTSFSQNECDRIVRSTCPNQPTPSAAQPSGAAAGVAAPAPVDPQPPSMIRKASANGPSSQQLVSSQTLEKPQTTETTQAITDMAKDETQPTKPVVELRGRIQAEAALVAQSNRDSTIIGPIEDAVGFRRARLGAQGNVGEQVRWVAEFDFAGGTVAFKDVYAALTNLPFVREVRVGNFNEPFSLETATSSNYITFVERSSADVFDPARHWGVGLFSYTDNECATLQAGVFRSGSNNTGNDTSNSRDMQYTARATALPWYDSGTVDGPHFWHIGGAISQQYAKNNTITYNDGTQSNLLPVADNPGSPFQPTITISASQQQLYNAQTAVVLGPLTFQAEWYLADIEQLKGGPVVFNGGYVQASYFLTGEHREYLTRQGVLARSTFVRRFGA